MRAHLLILTHERLTGLRALLASIRAQHTAGLLLRILVLDNGSADAPAHGAAQACRDYGAEYHRSADNTYMRGKRVLEALAFAEGPTPDVIVHLDDDVTLGPGWLSAVTAPLRAGKLVACGSVETWQGRLVYSGQRQVRIAEELLDGQPVRLWHWQWQDVDRSIETARVDFAGHRALAVVGDLATICRHDPAYVIGGEDLDYSLELRRLAPEGLGIATSAVIRHRAGGEQDALGFRTREHVLRSWRHFYGKWGFLRGGACSEAGLSPAEFVRAVTRPMTTGARGGEEWECLLPVSEPSSSTWMAR